MPVPHPGEVSRAERRRRYAFAVRYSGTERDEDSPGWFRLGQLEVTTTTLVVLTWVVTLLIWTAEPVSKPLTDELFFTPDDVVAGEVWRIFTWPWAHAGFSLWDIIGAAVFWIFGNELEREVGRRPFAALLGASVVIIPLAAILWAQLLPGDTVFADLDLLGLVVVLLYCAEHPTRPFFFNIPAWVIAAVIVALEVINDLAYRDWIRLLTVILAAGLIALVARKVGLLTEYDRVPDVKLPGRRNGSGGRGGGGAGAASTGRGRGGAPAAASESKRSLWGRKEQNEPAEIVQMPQRPRPVEPATASAASADFSADDIALDLLLDKISAGGLDSLTDAERQALDELRARRRNRPTP